MSEKIHAMCNALGNPIEFHLTAGQKHDLEEADVLLNELQPEALLADKTHDADKRVRERLQKKECEADIPSKSNLKELYPYDKELYQARHVIESIIFPN